LKPSLFEIQLFAAALSIFIPLNPKVCKSLNSSVENNKKEDIFVLCFLKMCEIDIGSY